VNDNLDVERAEGGSHWSLLVFHRRGQDGNSSDSFHHYDSAGAMNIRAAEALASAVGPCIGASHTAAMAVSHAPTSAPRQQNGYDCGLYVLAAANAILDTHSGGGAHPSGTGDVSTSATRGGGEGGEEKAPTSALAQHLDSITPAFIEDFRFELLDLIETLSELEGGGAGEG
jgi:sentrin-specific protease 8